MSKVYCSLNGDKVGQKIADSIRSNDPESVRQTSLTFNQAHAEIDQWVEQRGGRIISASGDEGIYELESTMLPEVQSMMANYESKTGHTLSIGIGSSLLESTKAMIYGKMHSPGEIVQYSQDVESGIAPQEEQQAEQLAGEADGEQPPHEQGLAPEQDFAQDAEEQEDDEQDTDNIEADEETAVFGGNTEPEDQDFVEDAEEDVDSQIQDEAMQGDPSQDDLQDEGPACLDPNCPHEKKVDPDQDSDGIDDDLEDQMGSGDEEPEMLEEGEEPSEDQGEESFEGEEPDPAHEQGLAPGEEMVHDAEEQEDDEQDSDNIEADAEPKVFGGNTEPEDQDFAQDAQEDVENQDAEGSPLLDMVDANSEDQDMEGQEDQDMSEEGMEGEDQMMGDKSGEPQDLSPDDLMNPESMEDGDQQPDLKSKVMDTLMNFKNNKDKINAMQQSDPETYGSVIEMLNSMIEMAKQLNVHPEQEMQGQEDLDQVPEQEMEEGDENQDFEDSSEEEGEPEESDGEESEDLEEEPKDKKPAPKGKGFPPKK